MDAASQSSSESRISGASPRATSSCASSKRFPNGAGKQSFFQKRVPENRPEWLQTAVVSSAGIARMRMIRFLPAVVLGSLLWAIVYATVGMAAIAAWVALVLASPIAAVVIVVVLLGVLGFLIWRRARGKRQGPQPEELTTAEPAEGASDPTFSAAPPDHTDRSA